MSLGMNKRKNITLKLVGIAYDGKSIGNDIRIEIKVSEHVRVWSDVIQVGQNVSVDLELLHIASEETLLRIPMDIRVTEQDPLFHDSGFKKVVLKVDTNTKGSRRETYEVLTAESRGGAHGRKKAIFHLTFEVTIGEGKRYVIGDKDGWLRVRIEGEREVQPLPAYVHVVVDRIKDGREYFTVKEGLFKNRNGSVEIKDDGSSHIATGNPYTKGVQMKYSISKKTITLNGRSYHTRGYKSASWPKGFYNISIPDAPHSSGRRYLSVAPHALTWFPIAYDRERYLHVGTVSLGCVTVIDHSGWEEIYTVLIRARTGDRVNVGILAVVD